MLKAPNAVPRRYRTHWVAGLVLVAVAAPGTGMTAGLFESPGRRTAFLLSPQQVTVTGGAAISRGGTADGTVYGLDATFPVRPYFLVGISQPFIVASQPDGIENGLGDFVFRMRLRMHNGGGRSLYALAGISAGTGNTRLFPYSAQSLDIDLELAYVDTLAAFNVWIEAGAASVNRAPQNLPEDVRHTDFVRAAGGITVPLGPAPELRLGGVLLRYETGARRVLATTELVWTHSAMLQFRVAAQAETGPESERVGDYAFGAGLTVRY